MVNFYPRKGIALEQTAELLAQHQVNFARRGGGLRLSTHAFNTDAEIDFVLNLLKI